MFNVSSSVAILSPLFSGSHSAQWSIPGMYQSLQHSSPFFVESSKILFSVLHPVEGQHSAVTPPAISIPDCCSQHQNVPAAKGKLIREHQENTRWAASCRPHVAAELSWDLGCLGCDTTQGQWAQPEQTGTYKQNQRSSTRGLEMLCKTGLGIGDLKVRSLVILLP